mmetsp:Transcript_20687/g.50195  ORF Transcript_20687/g.50195 Transcript_20687/m.50195 type:complete len:220 (+) Transcript_20687:869-1528(+)
MSTVSSPSCPSCAAACSSSASLACSSRPSTRRFLPPKLMTLSTSPTTHTLQQSCCTWRQSSSTPSASTSPRLHHTPLSAASPRSSPPRSRSSTSAPTSRRSPSRSSTSSSTAPASLHCRPSSLRCTRWTWRSCRTRSAWCSRCGTGPSRSSRPASATSTWCTTRSLTRLAPCRRPTKSTLTSGGRESPSSTPARHHLSEMLYFLRAPLPPAREHGSGRA